MFAATLSFAPRKYIYVISFSYLAYPLLLYWGRVGKRFRSPGIEYKKSIPPAYVAWRAGTSNRVVVLARQAGNQFLGFLKFTNSGPLFSSPSPSTTPDTPPPPLQPISFSYSLPFSFLTSYLACPLPHLDPSLIFPPLAISLAYPSREEGDILLVQMISPCLPCA